MSWIAIPFDDELKDEISEYLGVNSIPTLIVFNKNEMLLIMKEVISSIGINSSYYFERKNERKTNNKKKKRIKRQNK